jgi:hypothetical protein
MLRGDLMVVKEVFAWAVGEPLNPEAHWKQSLKMNWRCECDSDNTSGQSVTWND